MWSRASHADIHIVNTPATSTFGNPQISSPGWSLALLRGDGMTVTTYTYLSDHPWPNQSHDFQWRS
jgi:hypothetical protein